MLPWKSFVIAGAPDFFFTNLFRFLFSSVSKACIKHSKFSTIQWPLQTFESLLRFWCLKKATTKAIPPSHFSHLLPYIFAQKKISLWVFVLWYQGQWCSYGIWQIQTQFFFTILGGQIPRTFTGVSMRWSEARGSCAESFFIVTRLEVLCRSLRRPSKGLLKCMEAAQGSPFASKFFLDASGSAVSGVDWFSSRQSYLEQCYPCQSLAMPLDSGELGGEGEASGSRAWSHWDTLIGSMRGLVFWWKHIWKQWSGNVCIIENWGEQNHIVLMWLF